MAKKFIDEFNVGDVVESYSGRYKIIKFKQEVITTKTTRKTITKSAKCINERGNDVIISVNLNKNFTLAEDQSWNN